MTGTYTTQRRTVSKDNFFNQTILRREDVPSSIPTSIFSKISSKTEVTNPQQQTQINSTRRNPFARLANISRQTTSTPNTQNLNQPTTTPTTPLISSNLDITSNPATGGYRKATREKGDVKKIVIHETLGATTDAAVTTLKQRGLSYNYIIDNDTNGAGITEYVDPKKGIAYGTGGKDKDGYSYNAQSVQISLAHTKDQQDISAKQQDSLEKMIRNQVDEWYNGEPLEVGYHAQCGGTECNAFGTHAAYENWVKTRLGDLLASGKIKLMNTGTTHNQVNQRGTQVLTAQSGNGGQNLA